MSSCHADSFWFKFVPVLRYPSLIFLPQHESIEKWHSNVHVTLDTEIPLKILLTEQIVSMKTVDTLQVPNEKHLCFLTMKRPDEGH